MTEELGLPCHYKVFQDLENNTYYFSTDTGAQYEVLFTDGSSIFSSTQLESFEIYNIVINKTKIGTGKRDTEIALTIEAVLEHFFKSQNRILIYTCDSADSRHLLRSRLINTWFENSKLQDSIVKLDHQFTTTEPIYYSSLIFHKANKLGESAIIATFDELTLILSEYK